jgi:hypothetical protein
LSGEKLFGVISNSTWIFFSPNKKMPGLGTVPASERRRVKEITVTL